MMEKKQVVALRIEDMSSEGAGIGKTDEGFTVFVPGAVIGDQVKAELTKVKKHYAFGRLIELVVPSPHRITPACAYDRQCGGCVYGSVDYAAQLALKEKQVRDKLTRLGGIAEPVVRPIIGMASGGDGLLKDGPFHYRNKAVMTVSTGGLLTRKGGIVMPVHEPRIGFYQAKTHEAVDCENCLLQAEPAMAAARALRQFMLEDHIPSYDVRWDKGLMRRLIVRTAMGTGEVMVILVVNGQRIPNGEKLVRMLDEAINQVPVYAEGPLSGVEFTLESVILNVVKGPERPGQPPMSDECITLAGKPTILEEMGGLRFEISPLSFYQVNRRQVMQLYDKALSYAALQGGETVLDLYCGVGTIGLFAAAEMARKAAAGTTGSDAGTAAGTASGPAETAASCDATGGGADGLAVSADYQGANEGDDACNATGDYALDDRDADSRTTMSDCGATAGRQPGRVIGIESVKAAVLDANRNAVINGIVNARFICGKAEDVLPTLVGGSEPGQGADSTLQTPTGADAEAQSPASNGKDALDDDLRLSKADVVFLDPPRAGCEEKLLAAVATIAPERIVYVSCDPATLARDVKYLCANGYAFVEATPVDMFPWTGHVESVALLLKSNRKSKHDIYVKLSSNMENYYRIATQ